MALTLGGITRITLGASSDLATLLAAGTGTTTIQTYLKRLAIVPDAAATACNIAFGAAATANHAEPPQIAFPCLPAEAARIYLYGSGYADVWQFAGASD